jgi:Ring finger domain
MNNYTSIFRVGILDDLHNYFPDLLYNSDRFRSVQDVLRYIQRGARTQFNPFEQGLREYNRNNHITQIPVVDSRMTRDVSSEPQRVSFTSSNVSQQVPLTTSNLPETPVRVRAAGTGEAPQTPAPIRRRPMTYYWADSLIPSRYENNLIDTSMLTNLFTMALNQNFTDVPVVPTNQQVDAATTLGMGGSTEPCAICQDAVEPTQPVRRINRCQHAFHRSCIDTWFESGVTCPICRVDIRDR